MLRDEDNKEVFLLSSDINVFKEINEEFLVSIRKFQLVKVIENKVHIEICVIEENRVIGYHYLLCNSFQRKPECITIKGISIENLSSEHFRSWKQVINKQDNILHWDKLSDLQKKIWLDIASQYALSKTSLINPKRIFLIRGELIKSLLDFYYLLGRSINGIFGYYGKNLDSLADCFYGGYGIQPPFTIHWINYSQSKLEKEDINALIEIIENNNIKLIKD